MLQKGPMSKALKNLPEYYRDNTDILIIFVLFS